MDSAYARMMRKAGEANTVRTCADASKPTSQPWVEKYRPKKMDDVVFQDEIVKVLRNSLTGSDFPNFLFYGPPGTGKTSTILALAKEMFREQYKQRVLELNASDERGIAVIRNKVKQFAQTSVHATGTAGCSFKLIVLDEADSMTKDAQSALRRIMEKESRSTRFCLICNYISRIIEPIASRCAKFRFKPLPRDAINGRLSNIVQQENVKIAVPAVLDEIIDVSEGDLRKAITYLQTASRMNASEAGIQVDDVHEISGYVPLRYVQEIIDSCIKKKSHEQAEKLIRDLIYNGYSASQFLTQLHNWLLSDKCSLKEEQISTICMQLSKSDHALLEGANEFLQVLNIASCIIEVA